MEWSAHIHQLRRSRQRRQLLSERGISLVHVLTELRKRLLWSLFSLLLGMAVAWHFSDRLLGVIERPLSGESYLLAVQSRAYTAMQARLPWLAERLPREPGSTGVRQADRRLNYTAPLEPFYVQVKLSLLAGVVCALPLILYHVWRLAAPGLSGNHKWFLLPVIVVGTLSFVAGAVFFLWILWPVIINFSLSYESAGLRSWFGLTEYVNFCLRLICVFGLVFELPLAATVLARVGVLTGGFLARQRRFAVLGSAVIAAFHADLVTMAVVWVPLYLMYELSIWSARLFGMRAAIGATP